MADGLSLLHVSSPSGGLSFLALELVVPTKSQKQVRSGHSVDKAKQQQLHKFGNEIVLMFTNTAQRQLYQEVAADFRIPYWDWSLAAPKGETYLPDVFWSPVIQQDGPNGIQNIKNPLYSAKWTVVH
ncbi:hypothetical protein E4U30_007514 [Claviceps sp. LM220 group G6]|nr:hypothetical protein E4U30_007514 [Claviceps sp. LM220 group G6]